MKGGKILNKKFILFILIILSLFTTSSVIAQDRVHVVKRGENLWRICKKYNVKYSKVLNYNSNIKNPRIIFRGQKIVIPDLTANNNNNMKSSSQSTEKNGKTSSETQSGKSAQSSDMTAQVVELVNKERVSRGLQPLTIDTKLKECAQAKAQDMVNKNYFAHTSPTYGSPFNMMEQWGIKFTAAGENIAQGQRTAQEVMTSWMNSPGHRSNILSDSFSEIGVGVAKNSKGVLYWSQMFMRPAIGH